MNTPESNHPNGTPADMGFVPTDIPDNPPTDQAPADALDTSQPQHPELSPQHLQMRRRLRAIRRKELSSRSLVLIWCGWLLGSWTVTWLMYPGGLGVRLMVFAVMIGLMILWPTMRLSQDESAHHLTGLDGHDEQVPARELPVINTPGHVLVDWLFLNLVMQTVIWPLQLNAAWDLKNTLWLDAALASWSLLTGCLIAWGCMRRSHIRRTLAMVLCVLLLVGEPALLAMLNAAGAVESWTLRISPIEAIWHLATPGLSDPQPWHQRPYVEHIIAAAVAAVLGWTLLIIWYRRERRQTVTEERERY